MIQAKRFRKAELARSHNDGANTECDDSCSLAPPANKEKKHSDEEEENESEHETESIAEAGLLSEDDVRYLFCEMHLILFVVL